ncbi:hypothetical protein [Haloplasma contractile]|uniref:Uncharacterized protein n=1 Tax=Haloplasma contractile SSD-17B TaxID=1033810 RepID=U2E873_9MOLU|nr:hypothetical protein [Haloplasma contractile]ERJ11081.1 hypothetical protein HLPCO_002902 [Haloplasma contractile SSD-17B]
MNQNYNTNYTMSEIEELLAKVKRYVRAEQFIVSLNANRIENQRFIDEYRLTKEHQKDILLGIDVVDFCYSVQNRKPRYRHETLYVFCPQKTLYNVLGEEEEVDIYIKFNIRENANSNNVITISLHKPNKPITYLFR